MKQVRNAKNRKVNILNDRVPREKGREIQKDVLKKVVAAADKLHFFLFSQISETSFQSTKWR